VVEEDRRGDSGGNRMRIEIRDGKKVLVDGPEDANWLRIYRREKAEEKRKRAKKRKPATGFAPTHSTGS
jgi:hypothetical protein